MAEFVLHTVETAPEKSKPLLEKSLKGFGMIPNLHAVFAESPQTLEAYQKLTEMVMTGSLSTTERHVVWLAINVYHRCHYCVPAHTMLAKGDKVDDAIIEALRSNSALPDERLEKLRAFTLNVVENRGDVDEAAVDAFLADGFTKANILDIITVVAHKVISNYTNHLAHTAIDAPFAAFGWDVPAKAAE